MKTILWAILSANGNYAQRYPSKEALDDFAAQVGRSGNFITGRKAFELIQGNENRRPGNTAHAFTKPDIVVLSRRGGSIPGVTVVRSPQEALKYLSAKGCQTALIAGGEKTHNAFLAENLVDEFVFNIAPTLESEGLKIFLPKDSSMEINLLTFRELGGGLVQLHYAIQGEGQAVQTALDRRGIRKGSTPVYFLVQWTAEAADIVEGQTCRCRPS